MMYDTIYLRHNCYYDPGEAPPVPHPKKNLIVWPEIFSLLKFHVFS